MEKSTKIIISLLFVLVFAFYLSSAIVGAVYTSGLVPPNGTVGTTWAEFESKDEHPTRGRNIAKAYYNGCFTATVRISGTNLSNSVTGCYWGDNEQTADLLAFGQKQYPYAAWLSQ